jgi:hypothetical protein
MSMRALPLLSMAPCPFGKLMCPCMGACQGNDASNEFFLALAKDNSSVAAGEYYRYATGSHMSFSCINTFTAFALAVYSSDQAPEMACRAGCLLTRARRLLTATTLHAGLLHLGLNCAALASVGPEAEAVLGYAGFATVLVLPTPIAVRHCKHCCRAVRACMWTGHAAPCMPR